MPSEIKCPNCGHPFNADKQLEADLERKLRADFQQKMNANLKTVEDEKQLLAAARLDFEQKKKRENEIFNEKINAEKVKIQRETDEQLRKSISADYDNQIKILLQGRTDAEEKLKISRQKELEFMQKEKDLKDREEAMEIEYRKRIMKEREGLTEQIRQQETAKARLKDEEHDRKLKELEIKLDAQKKHAEEMQRRLEQGSMQLQGEAQELLLEEILQRSFFFDGIEPVGKGIRGADCIQYVHTQTGTRAGIILYESKRTKEFHQDWIDKLKADMRTLGADVAILVTQAWPKDMKQFGEKDGIWICGYSDVVGVATIMRGAILQVHRAQKNEENKGEKMQMLYDYLTGPEFRGQVEAIMEGFISLKNGITKERVQMEKIWKEREKHLEKVLLSTSGMYGSVKGIAGASVGDIPLLDGGTEGE